MNPFKTHGAISWPELMTSDPKAAAAFYASVFGWESDVMPMPPDGEYTICRIGQAPCAGMMGLPEPGTPVAWMFYITVDDIVAAVEKAVSLGATNFLPPKEVGVGTLAGIQDPQGAYIMMIQYADSDQEADVDFASYFQTPGAFSWFELRTPDPDGAIAFYTGLFDWEVATDEMGMGPYHVIKIGGVSFGGIIPPQGEAPPHWGAYVTVDDIDATVEKVRAAGGTVAMDPFMIEKVGRFSMIQDPQGAWLAPIQYVPMEEAQSS